MEFIIRLRCCVLVELMLLMLVLKMWFWMSKLRYGWKWWLIVVDLVIVSKCIRKLVRLRLNFLSFGYSLMLFKLLMIISWWISWRESMMIWWNVVFILEFVLRLIRVVEICFNVRLRLNVDRFSKKFLIKFRFCVLYWVVVVMRCLRILMLSLRWLLLMRWFNVWSLVYLFCLSMVV